MRSAEASGEQHIYLAPQHKDGVDVRQDAVETEVDVWTDQRKNRGQDAGSRLELRKKTGHAYFVHTASKPIISLRKINFPSTVWASTWVGLDRELPEAGLDKWRSHIVSASGLCRT